MFSKETVYNGYDIYVYNSDKRATYIAVKNKQIYILCGTEKEIQKVKRKYPRAVERIPRQLENMFLELNM